MNSSPTTSSRNSFAETPSSKFKTTINDDGASSTETITSPMTVCTEYDRQIDLLLIEVGTWSYQKCQDLDAYTSTPCKLEDPSPTFSIQNEDVNALVPNVIYLFQIVS